MAVHDYFKFMTNATSLTGDDTANYLLTSQIPIDETILKQALGDQASYLRTYGDAGYQFKSAASLPALKQLIMVSTNLSQDQLELISLSGLNGLRP